MEHRDSEPDASSQPDRDVVAKLSERLGTAAQDKNTYNTPPTENCSSTPTSTIVNEINEIGSYIQEARKYRIEVTRKVMSMQQTRPSVPPSLEKRLGLLQISFALSMVMNYLLWEQFELARKEAQRALKIAEGLKDELSIARCNYWLGRIEFERQNMSAAHTFFKAARPCIIDDEHPEGSSLYFYLGLSKLGIGEDYRKRTLLDHNLAMIKSVTKEPGSTYPRIEYSRKRKRESNTWNLVLRPANRSQRTQPGSEGGKSQKPPSQHTNRSTIWMVRDTEDMPRPFKKSIEETRESQSDGMEWLAAAQSRPRLEQCKFSIRCYPKGLAPRTRPTTIFSEQPIENILPSHEWQALHTRFQDRRITMSYLARERQKNREAAKDTTQESPATE